MQSNKYIYTMYKTYKLLREKFFMAKIYKLLRKKYYMDKMDKCIDYI